MARLEELANAAKSTMMKYQMLGLIRREVDNDIKLEKKLRELYEEVTATLKDRGEVIEKLERLLGNLVAVESVCVLKRVQKRDLEKATRFQIMVAECHLSAHEKLLFATKINEGLLG